MKHYLEEAAKKAALADICQEMRGKGVEITPEELEYSMAMFSMSLLNGEA